ncbi:hypothetical protein KXV98_007020, partial [Aspergillus fumigatus]
LWQDDPQEERPRFTASGAIDTVELCGFTVSRATSHLGSIAATLGAFGVRIHTDMAPQLSQSKGWDCAERVELHTAFRALELASTHSSSEHYSFSRLRAYIMGVRRAAVHRQPQGHCRLLQQLRSAHEFAT